jgi:predicted deacetylase
VYRAGKQSVTVATWTDSREVACIVDSVTYFSHPATLLVAPELRNSVKVE